MFLLHVAVPRSPSHNKEFPNTLGPRKLFVPRVLRKKHFPSVLIEQLSTHQPMLNVREVQEVFVVQNCKTNVPFWSHLLIQSWCVGVKSSIFVNLPRSWHSGFAAHLTCISLLHIPLYCSIIESSYFTMINSIPQFFAPPFKQIPADSTWPHIHDIIIHAYPSHKVWISLLKAFNLLLWVSPLDSWDWSGKNGCIHPGTPWKFKGEPI